jgi:hypothetical protein
VSLRNAMENIEKHQKQLLEQTQSLYRDTPISEATEQAYLATPRHRFVRRYREWGTKEWQVVEPESLAEHIATLYANRPLILCGTVSKICTLSANSEQREL